MGFGPAGEVKVRPLSGPLTSKIGCEESLTAARRASVCVWAGGWCLVSWKTAKVRSSTNLGVYRVNLELTVIVEKLY